MGIFQNLAVIGLFRQERRHELIANNLSNAQTAGFKKDVPVFHRIFSEAFSSYQLGEFETSVTSFQQGELQATRNPLDLAIEGEGSIWKTPGASGRLPSMSFYKAESCNQQVCRRKEHSWRYR